MQPPVTTDIGSAPVLTESKPALEHTGLREPIPGSLPKSNAKPASGSSPHTNQILNTIPVPLVPHSQIALTRSKPGPSPSPPSFSNGSHGIPGVSKVNGNATSLPKGAPVPASSQTPSDIAQKPSIKRGEGSESVALTSTKSDRSIPKPGLAQGSNIPLAELESVPIPSVVPASSQTPKPVLKPKVVPGCCCKCLVQ